MFAIQTLDMQFKYYLLLFVYFKYNKINYFLSVIIQDIVKIKSSLQKFKAVRNIFILIVPLNNNLFMLTG